MGPVYLVGREPHAIHDGGSVLSGVPGARRDDDNFISPGLNRSGCRPITLVEVIPMNLQAISSAAQTAMLAETQKAAPAAVASSSSSATAASSSSSSQMPTDTVSLSHAATAPPASVDVDHDGDSH